jgi:hypothetical protein
VCNSPAMPNELICEVCYGKFKEDAHARRMSAEAANEQQIADRWRDRWEAYLSTFPHLHMFIKNDVSVVKHSEYKNFESYFKDFKVNTNNAGKGLLYIDLEKKHRKFTFYTIYQVISKCIKDNHGLISFDYTHFHDCIPNVFQPTDSLYATSDFLIIDDVNLQEAAESKQLGKALVVFLKYRLHMYKPTFMIASEACSASNKELWSTINETFGHTFFFK